MFSIFGWSFLVGVSSLAIKEEVPVGVDTLRLVADDGLEWLLRVEDALSELPLRE